jgi:hypothetical protein
MKIRNLLPIFILILIITSCRKEVIDLDKKSDTLEFEKSLVGPIVKGAFLLSDITGKVDSTDTEVLVIDGDTVKLHIFRDSLLQYNTADLVVIPNQDNALYRIETEIPIDVAILDAFFDTLITEIAYPLSLSNSMRLDSMVAITGSININLTNTFNYDVSLNFYSDSLISPDNLPLDVSIPINAGSYAYPASIDLTGYKLIFGHTSTAATIVKMKLTPNFDKNSGSGDLLPGQYIDINVSFSDMNDFGILYGFMGYQSVSYDTVTDIIIEDMEDELSHIDGTFQSTNPKIRVNYIQSFGVPLGADLYADVYHHDAPDALIDLEPRIIPALEYPTDPKISGSLLFSNVENINELLTFPIADSLHVNGFVTTNLGMDSVTTKNFVNRNSEMMLSLDIELPLEFRADLTYYDTLEFPLKDEIKETDDYEFDYLNLHSWFTNTFPISFDAMLLLYNAELGQIVDSIDLNSLPGKPFIKAAPIDANGIVILSGVTEEHGVIALDDETANNLLLRTTDLIVKAKIQSFESNSVKVLHTSKLNFQFAIEAKGKGTTKIE